MDDEAWEDFLDGMFPMLTCVAQEGTVAQVRALLDQGADIEATATGSDNCRALHFACGRGHRGIVSLLLRRGANIEALGAGLTPIIFASLGGHLDIVELLHTRGANIHRTNASGETALHRAAWEDHLPVCEFLLSKGLDLMATDNKGRTALSHYGYRADSELMTPETKALRIAALEGWWAVGPHPLQLQRRNEALLSEVARLSAVTQTNASLLFSNAFSDLVFVCPGGVRIHAHRNIVSACSAHARALLQGPWAENADERVAVVQMPQSAAAVRALLCFMYTAEFDAAAVDESISDVLDLASQHEQPALKAACERHAIAALSVPTVVPILVAAHLHELAALKAACVALIKANSLVVTESKHFNELETTHPLQWRELRAALGLPEGRKRSRAARKS